MTEDSDSASTTRLLRAYKRGPSERNQLLSHAWQRLQLHAQQLLRTYPDVQRWQESSDILNQSLARLHRALDAVEVTSSRFFWNLAKKQIKRVLLDAARHHRGPRSFAANYETNANGHAADDAGQVLHCGRGADRPKSPMDRLALLEAVNRLPEKLENVFFKIYYLGMSQEETAAVLEISVRTVRRRYREALLRLYEGL